MPRSAAPPASRSRAWLDRFFNRVIGLDSTEPLDEIAAFYGDTPWWVSDSHGLGPELEERGFTDDYGWMKFSRGVGPREAHSDLRVVPGGRGSRRRLRARRRRRVRAAGLDEPFAANVVGRPGWSCYVAYDGDAPAGAGALYVDGGVGWLGFGATLPAYRGRGAQSAILAARIEDARRQGCRRWSPRPASSTTTARRARTATSSAQVSARAGVRPNYRAPSV